MESHPQRAGSISLATVREGNKVYTNVYNVEAQTNRVQKLAAQLRPSSADNPTALVSFSQGVERLVNRMAQRTASVGQQLQEAHQPLAFDAAGQAKLTDWRPQRDSGSPSFSSNSGGRNGSRLLEIRASGARAYGSWRTTVLIEKGEYQFVGQAQTEGLEIGPDVMLSGGVTLRLSGERAAKMVEKAEAWRTLSYDFTMGQPSAAARFRTGLEQQARFIDGQLKSIHAAACRVHPSL